jgi:myosin heavy subunit
LRTLASEADEERVVQNKELEAVIQERDVLAAQIVRRNDELAIVYEKIKLLQGTLSKGETEYTERLEDIKQLKSETKKLREECALLERDCAAHDGLKTEVIQLQREIITEKLRVKALEDELQNPVNIHRWRKLEGTDPESFELIKKVHNLQRRLITKTEEVVEKEMAISQREKMYKQLKEVLARQPGPEVVDRVTTYQVAIREKTNQLKAMVSELNMYQSQVTENKSEIDNLQREMQSVKKRYFDQKKKQLSKDRKLQDTVDSVFEAGGGLQLHVGSAL